MACPCPKHPLGCYDHPTGCGCQTTKPDVAETHARPSTIVISDWLANFRTEQWTPFEAGTALKAALAKEGYAVIAESEMVEQREDVRESKELASENFTRAKTAESELAGARQSILKFGHHTASCAWSVRGATCNCGWLAVSRAARAFQGEK